MKELIHKNPILRALFVDQKGDIVIWQTPNAWLVSGLAFAIIAAFTHGAVHQWTNYAGILLLGIWSVLEIISGADWFRRLLGLAVFIDMVLNVVRLFR